MADKEYIFIEGFALGKNYLSLLKCLYVSKTLHEGQYRKSGEDYITHPTAVTASLIRSNILDETTLCISQLHDVYEDCKVSRDTLINQYKISERVVDGIIRLSKTHDTDLKTYFNEISNHKEETMVKIADRTHNISTMTAFTIPKQIEYVKETKDYVIPLCKKARRIYPEYSLQIIEKKREIENMITITEYYLNLINAEKKEDDS